MKKKIDRVLSALLALLLCFGLAGCGSEPKKPVSSDGESTSDPGTPGEENEVPSGKEDLTIPEDGGGDEDEDDDNVCGPDPENVYFHNYWEFAQTYQALDVSEEDFEAYHNDSTKCKALRDLSWMSSLTHAREAVTVVGNVPILLFEGTRYTMSHVNYSLYWDTAEIMYDAGDGIHWAILGLVNSKTEDALAITVGKEKVCEFALPGDEEKHITIYNGADGWLPYFAVLDDETYSVVFRCNEYFKGGLEKFEEVMRGASRITFFGEMEKKAG